MTEPTLYLLDTNIISDLMRHPSGNAAQHVAHKARHNKAHGMATSVIVQCELLFGMRRLTSPRWQQQYRSVMNSLEVLPLEQEASQAYADLRAGLEAAGTPIGANDMLIAAHALSLGATLVSGDAEFSRVPGLQLENWLQPIATRT